MMIFHYKHGHFIFLKKLCLAILCCTVVVLCSTYAQNSSIVTGAERLEQYISDLKNKNIIVTGATGGIGNSIIKKLDEQGANILATGTKIEKLDDIKKEFKNSDVTINRFKGLGEMMPAQLKETTMSQENRTLLKVQIASKDKKKTHKSVDSLMGKKPELRFKFIVENSKKIAKKYSKDSFLVIEKLGTKFLPTLFEIKRKVDLLSKYFKFLPNKFSDHLMQFLSKFYPNHLPKRMENFKDKYDHLWIIEMVDDGIKEAKDYFEKYFPQFLLYNMYQILCSICTPLQILYLMDHFHLVKYGLKHLCLPFLYCDFLQFQII